MNPGGFSSHANMEVSLKKYEVFLSFRGEDTRRTFTSHLHEALKKKGIETFIDDEKLQRGDEISKALLDAIENSTISVIIFSEKYASSSWCLDELVHILHCKQNNNQTVLPVFYQVDPSDVRKQRGSYAEAFVKLEERFKDKINKWRDALTAAANLSGYDSSKSRNDPELIDKIVNDIKKKLYPTSSTLSDHLKGLVGIEKRIEDVKSLLTSAPIVGIWGMGGLGKTTLAKAVFKQCRSHFEGHCFLANVREEMQKKGETDLKKLLFGELSNEKDLDESVKTSLYRKKLLVVLDDIDDFDQFECLIEDWDWLNLETSRVIITSRDREVLRNIIKGDSAKVIYNLMELRQEDALKLFRLHAFKGNSAEEISYEEMSIKFVNYSGGVPLALKVLGSHLFQKSEEVWDSAWNKLKVDSNKKIIDILKISFDGLDSKEKEIFLDIACFFKGKNKDSVKGKLDEGGCFEDVITTLVDKSLITLAYDCNLEMHDYVLEMHDLLQEMGWKIARGPFPEEVGKYSRLWIDDDICRVLKNNTGTASIQGIFLRYPIDGEINLKPDVFTKMSSLRLLQIGRSYSQFRLHLPRGGLDSFPDTLRYLRWDYYPLESLGTPRDLVYLEMKESQLEKLWNEDQHDLRNLKYIYLNDSEKLTCLPDLSQANLKILHLEGCKSLVELPPLKFQDVAHKLTEKETDEIYYQVNNFGGFDPRFSVEDSANVQSLNLGSCSNLKTLSEMSGSINFISLRETRIEELHPSIGSLTNLVFLDLAYCKCLKNLPRSICDLGSLEYLDMSGCLSIDKFPELPKNIGGLDMSFCKNLESIPTSICKLKSLYKLDLSHCSELKTFPEILEPMENLSLLYLNGIGIKDIPSSIENLVMLPTLDLSDCKNLESIPTSICKLKSLKTLKLSGCSELKTFPEILEPMENLEELDLSGTGIKDIPSSIRNLVILETLNLDFCKNLESLPNSVYYMGKLKHLSGYQCPLFCLPSVLSLLPALDPSGTTSCELKCGGYYAGKIQVFSPGYYRYRYKFCKHSTYCECLIFYAIYKTSMVTDFLKNILKGYTESCHLGASFYYSGNKIPQWFTYQSMGSSIDVSFPQLRHDTTFLGFALCIVVAFDQGFSNPEYLDLDCECHLKNNNGGGVTYSWTRQKRLDAYSNLENHDLDWSSDHVFIWNLPRNDNYKYETGDLFKFYLGQSTDAFGKHRVKQCGICILYRQDTKELDFIELDFIKHVPGGDINSDANEPHPKRIKS